MQLRTVLPEERAPVARAGLAFFALLASTYAIRPLRDEMGIAGGVKNLSWLFTGTMLAMLTLNPLFSTLVVRLPRSRLVPATFAFFLANMGLLWCSLRLGPPDWLVPLSRVFFVWAAVFNLFVVSLFWSVMADCFHSAQGKRLFGYISAAGTLGSICGSLITSQVLRLLRPVDLLLIAAGLLLVALVALLPFLRREVAAPRGGERGALAPLEGLRTVVRSPYLLGICLYLLLYTTTGTFAYLQQAQATAARIADSAARTAYFARIDLWTNLLALALQSLVTARLLTFLGVGRTLMLLPLVTLLGQLSFTTWPTMQVLAASMAVRRAADYAIAKPAREVLWTVVGPSEKYAAKSFIDTFIYRGGDALAGWIFKPLPTLMLGPLQILPVALPVVALWAGLAGWLGRRQGEAEAARKDYEEERRKESGSSSV